MKKHALMFCVIAVFLWRVLLQGSAAVGNRTIPYAPTFPYAGWLHEAFGPWWMVRWAGFDGVHYLTLAREGYGKTANLEAFFPMYPLFLNLLSRIIPNSVVAGLLISHLMFGVVLLLLIKICQLEKHKNIVFLILLFLLFPTSYAFVSLYTESLFLALALGSWYAARKQRWLVAGLLCAAATATRVVGVFLIPALIVEAFQQAKEQQKRISRKILIAGLLGIFGILSYMVYLQLRVHDSLAFFHVQQAFGGNRQTNLIFFPQVVYRYLRMLATVPVSRITLTIAQEFGLTMLAGLVLSVMTYRTWKKRKMLGLRWSLLVYSWGSFLLPPLTGTFQSMPRYLLVIFPFFFFLSDIFARHRWLMVVYVLISGTLLLINTALFFQGIWVS